MINLNEVLGSDARELVGLLSERFPHLVYAVWDLTEFMPAFHDVRRNIVFVECDNVAREEVVKVLASERSFRNYLIFSGERKPKALNEVWGGDGGVVVVVARTDFVETEELEGNARFPVLERRLIDLVSYSLRGWLPVAVDDVVDALVWFLKRGRLRASFLRTYSTRRYLRGFIDVLFFKLVEKRVLGKKDVDSRYVAAGERYWLALKKVDGIE